MVKVRWCLGFWSVGMMGREFDVFNEYCGLGWLVD